MSTTPKGRKYSPIYESLRADDLHRRAGRAPEPEGQPSAAALYVKARRERQLRVFRPWEAVLFGIIVLGAVAAVVALATGAVEI